MTRLAGTGQAAFLPDTHWLSGVAYQVRLSRTYPRYGGVRFWFICPVRGKRVSKLYLIPSDGRFVSRHVYKIYYASQMKGGLDRAIDKKWKLLDKVDGTYFPQRSKGMHQKTFDRVMDKFIAQEELCDWMMIQRFGKMGLGGYLKSKRGIVPRYDLPCC